MNIIASSRATTRSGACFTESGYLKSFSHFIKLNDRKVLVAVAESWKFVIVIVFESVFAEMKLKVSTLFLVFT